MSGDRTWERGDFAAAVSNHPVPENRAPFGLRQQLVLRRSWWPADQTPGHIAFASPALILLLLSAGFLYLDLFIFPATPVFFAGDDNINFDGARRMLAGQSIYVDFFQYTLPGTELWYFALIKIFGARIWLLNGTLIVVGLATVWLGLVLSSAVLEGWTALPPILLFLSLGWYYTLDATHHKFSVALVYAAAAVLVRRRDAVRLVAAGALCGLATCFTQTRALAVVALGAFLVWEHTARQAEGRSLIRDVALLLVPFLAVVAAVCGYFAWELGFGRFLQLTIGFPLRYYGTATQSNSWSTVIPSIPPFDHASLLDCILMMVMVPAAFFLSPIYYWRRASRLPREPWAALMLLALIGLSLLASIGYAPHWHRLCEISLPAFILAVWWLAKSPRLAMARGLLWAAAFSLLIAMPARTQIRWHGYLDAPAGRVAFTDRLWFPIFQWMAAHTTPGEFFFWPTRNTMYPLLDLKNPIAVPFVTRDDYTRPEQVAAAVKALDRHPPRLIFWTLDFWTSDLGPFGNHLRVGDHLGPLRAYLRANYRPFETFPDGNQVWVRNSAAPPPH